MNMVAVHLAHVLGKGPLVAFRIGSQVTQVAPERVLELADDRGAG